MTLQEQKQLALKKITDSQIVDLAVKNYIDPNYLKGFDEVEGSGIGFSDYTGRMLIQFEPSWMKRFLLQDKEPVTGTWLNNGIGNQTVEYKAFEAACQSDKEAAMKSCSIGMMQVMGFHFKDLGFSSVQNMWSYADQSEINQLNLGVEFIKSNPVLYKAVKEKNSSVVAYYYNGAGYLALAKKLHELPYDKRLDNAYNKFSSASTIHKTTTTVNIRRGAGVSFDLAGDPLRVNTVVSILGYHNDWTHVAVVATGITGWVYSKYIN